MKKHSYDICKKYISPLPCHLYLSDTQISFVDVIYVHSWKICVTFNTLYILIGSLNFIKVHTR